MNILITGGAGFIGSHVGDECIRAGHKVIILDDLSSGVIENVHPDAVFHRIDIRDGSVGEILAREKVDVIIHHAAQMNVRTSVEDPAFDASVNILGSINLMEAGRKAGVRKFIFASTGGAIYGEQEYFPADEDHPTKPASPYGISKLAVEHYLRVYHETYGIVFINLRYANVYGPRQSPHGEAGVVAIFASKLLAGVQPVVNGDGKQTRDYIYIDDVVTANLSALHHPACDVFNVGTGMETDVNAIYEHLRRLTSSPIAAVHGPPKAGEQLRSVLDSTHLRRSFDWSPSVSLEEGLRRTVEFFRKKGR